MKSSDSSIAAKIRIGKRLKRALLELLLIVLGILIAVWINDLNEKRKDDQLARLYMTNICQDLRKDSAEISRSILAIRREMGIYEKQRERLTGPDANLDTLIRIARYEFTPVAVSLPAFHNNTFKSLESSGNTDLLPIWLNQALFELDKRQELAKNIERIVDDLYYRGAADHGDNYPLSIHMLNEGPVSNYIWENIDYDDLAASFNNLASLKQNKHFYENNELLSVLAQVNEILEKLRKEID